MKQDYFSAFRKSILQRISALEFANEKLRELEQSNFCGIKVYEITDWEDDAPKREKFLDLLQLEYEAKIKDLAEVLSNNTQDHFRITKRIEVSLSLKVNASLHSSRKWFDFIFKQPPKIRINLGLVLATEDAFGFFLCTKTFFTNRTSDGELTVMNPSFKIGISHPMRFQDYRDLLKDSKGFAQVLTTGIAFAPWRLGQFELLSEIGVAWTILHEQSHYLLGHLDKIENHQGKRRQIALNENERDIVEPSGLSHIRLKHFEMEADSQAISILFDLYFMNHQAQAIASYQNMILKLGYNDTQKESIIQLSTPKDHLRLLLLAAGLIIILLENKRLSNSRKTSNSYPSPVTRLFGLFFTIGIRYLGIEENAASKAKHSREDLKTLFGAYIESILDLQLAISLMDIKNDAFRPFIWEDPEKRNDNFSNDLFDIITKGYFDPNLVSTDAAKEFLTLKQYELNQD